MNRTKNITLKQNTKTKKAKSRNCNKPVYMSKAEREVLAAAAEARQSVEVSQD